MNCFVCMATLQIIDTINQDVANGKESRVSQGHSCALTLFFVSHIGHSSSSLFAIFVLERQEVYPNVAERGISLISHSLNIHWPY